MGANAQTSVPLFVANSVLTAAQQNISAATGIPVFSTTVTRDAAFGGSNKVLAEGQLCYLESTDVVQQYNGTAWVTVGPATASGLTLISATTVGTAVSSVTISSAFSATYDNYKIVLSGGTSSAVVTIGLKLGSTATGYYGSFIRYDYGSTYSGAFDNNAVQFSRFGFGNTNGLIGVCDLFTPQLAKNTFLAGGLAYSQTTNGAGAYHGFLNDTTQYTAFTLTPAGGTLTGGTVFVYGYANS